MIRNYLVLAIRHFTRHRIYSLINVIGLAIGMACCLLLWAWVRHELSYDQYNTKLDRIGRIVEEHKYPTGDPMYGVGAPYKLAPALATDYPEIEQIVRTRPIGRTLFTYRDKAAYEQGMFLADSNTFDLFTFPLVSGESQTALTGVNKVVIDEELAEKYFGQEEAVGKVLRLDNRLDVMVTGVMEKVPTSSHIRPRILISIESLDEFMDRDMVNHWAFNAFYTYVLVKPGVSLSEFGNKFKDAMHRYRTEGTIIDLQLQPLQDIHLGPAYQGDIAARGSRAMIILFAIIAAFILLIAAVNFVNLATARASERVLEVSIRKVVGADRTSLIRQFLGESVLLAAVSAALAIMLVELILPLFTRFAGQEISLNLFSDPSLLLFLLAIVLLMGVAAGAYPAFYLSSFRPIRGLRSRFAPGSIRLRGVLVMVQFTISIAMIVGTVIVYRQLMFARAHESGYERDQVLTFTLDGREAQDRYYALKSELLRLPQVASVTASAQLPSNIGWSATMWPEGGGESDKIQFSLNPVDHDYFATYGMTILEGQPLTGTNSSFDAGDSVLPIVINEEAARRVGWTEAVGKRLWGEGESRLQVIGVVKDFQFATVQKTVEPLLLYYDSTFFNVVSVKVTGDIPSTVSHIRSAWERLIPGRPFEYKFFDESFNLLYQSEERLSRILWAFTIVSIVIACLGLLGLAAFSVEQRTKETGIRKALGASVASLVVLHSTQFFKWIIAANLIAWPVSYYLLQKWLANYAYRVNLDWWVFGLAGGGALLIAMLTVGFLAIRAALANPVSALRYE